MMRIRFAAQHSFITPIAVESRRMSRFTQAPRRYDAVWILIPLLIPPLLFALGRGSAGAPAETLGRAAALALIPAGTLLALLASFTGSAGVHACFSQTRTPRSRAHHRILLSLICLISLLAAALLFVCGSAAPLQALFIVWFALLMIRAMCWPLPLAAERATFLVPRVHPAWLDYLALTKPALNAMVLVSVLMGFYLGSPGPLELPRLGRTLLGVALLACASATFNQFAERERDRRMPRTARRPLPSGRLRPRAAARFGAALALGGMAILACTVNLATAWLATFSLAIYLVIYTPLKRRGALATLAGAVSGALPPLLGWFGAGAPLTPGVLVLFCILYLWQIPHFLAIVWKYREQYRAAGFRLYGVLDPSGHATGLQALLYATALLPVSLMMTWHGLAGMPYLLGAFALGLSLIGFCTAFARRPTPGPTRRLFIASIAYLPLLLLFMVLDKWLG